MELKSWKFGLVNLEPSRLVLICPDKDLAKHGVRSSEVILKKGKPARV